MITGDDWLKGFLGFLTLWTLGWPALSLFHLVSWKHTGLLVGVVWGLVLVCLAITAFWDWVLNR